MRQDLLPIELQELLKLPTHEGFRNELLFAIASAFRVQQNAELMEKLHRFNVDNIKPKLSLTEVNCIATFYAKNKCNRIKITKDLQKEIDKL